MGGGGKKGLSYTNILEDTTLKCLIAGGSKYVGESQTSKEVSKRGIGLSSEG